VLLVKTYEETHKICITNIDILFKYSIGNLNAKMIWVTIYLLRQLNIFNEISLGMHGLFQCFVQQANVSQSGTNLTEGQE